MTPDEMKAALEAMAQEQEGKFSELRKPTPTEVRQSRTQFAIHPQAGIASFTLHCLYCGTGREFDYLGSLMPQGMVAFFGAHERCKPGSLPPEVRARIPQNG